MIAQRSLTALVTLSLPLVIGACGDDEKSTTDTRAETSSDTTADTAVDSTSDTTADSAPDTAVDSAPDTTVDSAADTTPDITPDITIDPNDVIGSVGRSYAGTLVSLLGSTDEMENLPLAAKEFLDATGITLFYTDHGDLTELLAGDPADAPDLVFIPQPGYVASLARSGDLIERPELATFIAANHTAGWKELGTVDGKFYGAAVYASVKSLVWYDPTRFTAAGYEIPTTWAELLALSDTIVADGGKPWCVGLESGDATGWPGTDWVEDLLLRTSDVATYDAWVTHAIPFDDPAIQAAFDEAAKILKNEDYIAGGVASEATSNFFDSVLGLLDGTCWMHRQADWAMHAFPEETAFGPDGTVDVFYLPGVTTGARPILGGGDLLVALNDRPEVTAVMTYLVSLHYANSRMKLGAFLSPHRNVDLSEVANPILATVNGLLHDATVFRFDGSDLMPEEVGAGTFWTGIVDWIGGKSTAEVTATIEASWPE